MSGILWRKKLADNARGFLKSWNSPCIFLRMKRDYICFKVSSTSQKIYSFIKQEILKLDSLVREERACWKWSETYVVNQEKSIAECTISVAKNVPEFVKLWHRTKVITREKKRNNSGRKNDRFSRTKISWRKILFIWKQFHQFCLVPLSVILLLFFPSLSLVSFS